MLYTAGRSLALESDWVCSVWIRDLNSLRWKPILWREPMLTVVAPDGYGSTWRARKPAAGLRVHAEFG